MIHDKLIPEDDAFEILQGALNANTIGIDTETNGEDIRDGRGYALGVSLAWENPDGSGPTALYLPFRHRNLGGASNYSLPRFLPILQTLVENCTVVYHNAKFDLVSLSTLGLETYPGRRFVCTMVLAHLINENQPFSKSLDACAEYYLGIKGAKHKTDHLKKAIKLYGWGSLTPDLIYDYAAFDAYLCLKLYEKLKPLAQAEGLGATWLHKMKFTELLVGMEGNGIRIDTDLCHKMTEQGEHEMQLIRDDLGLNPGSPKDLKELLIDHLKLPYIYHQKTGNPTFDKTAMADYEEILERSNNTTARQILAYRGWQKSVSSNYRPYVELLSPDGRLRPNYKMHGTKTGRLSCEKPNLQQIPKAGVKPWNGMMKKCFVPATGYVLIGFDYSQLELRVGTAYAEDPSLIEVFRQDRDIFTEMSKELRLSRNDTKTLVYATQYGAGVNRLASGLNLDSKRASEIRQRYYETYPGFRTASQYASNLAVRDRRVRLWSGRYRHFQYPKEESFKAFNNIIQGGSADIVERAMLRVQALGFHHDECRMLLQVHDELIFEVREDLVDKYTPAIREAMTTVDYHPKFLAVKFAADSKLWGDK